jgi:ketosteroid isomerase-like protein
MPRGLLGLFVIGLALSWPVRAAQASDDFVCTEVLGVSVTGDWFGAGFESGIDGSRWQARSRSHAFVELWADPASDLWALPPQSACTKRSDDPDRVIFTAVNWEWKTREEWESRLEGAVATIRAKRPGARRIELMTMLRGPGNQTCGSEMTVVQPYVDEAIAAVVARHPRLVFAAPKVFLKTCAPFLNGGPHYTDAGMAVVADAYREQLARVDTGDRAEILRLEDVWNEAHRRGDAEALEKLWADDLVVTVPNMAVMTKADVLPIFRSGRMKFRRYETSDTEVRMHGDAAIVTGRLRRTREVGGRTFDDDWRFTKTYVREGGRWQVAAFEATTQGEPATMSDEQQIKQAIAQFVEAYNAGDADRIASYYADDLVKLRAGAPAEAKDDTVRRVKDVMARFQGRLEVHNDEITVAGNMAFTRGHLVITLTPRAEGAPQTIERRFLEVWRKDAGRWRVIRAMDNAG